MQQFPSFVLVRQVQFEPSDGPLDAKRRIVEAQRDFGLRRIHVVNLVLELRNIAQDEETVGKMTRHKQLPPVFMAQLHSQVLPVGGRPGAQINNHIDNLAERNPHELRLAVLATLEVKPPQHASRRQRLVVLDEINLAYRLLKLRLLETFTKIPTRVAMPYWLYQPHAFDALFYEFHLSPFYASQRYKNHFRKTQ